MAGANLSTKINFESKILSQAELIQSLKEQAKCRPLVFTNGVFDILHRGHVSYLDQARQLGACLVVAINTDASVRRLNKGPERPVNPLDDRMALLAALTSVDYVTSFDEDTPYAIIQALQPDIIVKGGDYDMQALPETKLVQSWGGKAYAIPFAYNRSTTKLVSKIACQARNDATKKTQ